MKKLQIITWKEDDWYIAKSLDVEVASQGRSEKEAIKNLKEALELYFEDEEDIEVTEFLDAKLQSVSVNINA